MLLIPGIPTTLSRRHATSAAGLVLPFPKGRQAVSPASIVRLESDTNYTTFWFADGTCLCVAVTLKRLIPRLPAGLFFRVHRKHLVNRAFMHTLDVARLRLTLTTGACVAVSRRRLAVAKTALSEATNGPLLN
jgi:DNA-binding LytR/AlgR family response regulator